MRSNQIVLLAVYGAAALMCALGAWFIARGDTLLGGILIGVSVVDVILMTVVLNRRQKRN